jgi:hypothetical protein
MAITQAHILCTVALILIMIIAIIPVPLHTATPHTGVQDADLTGHCLYQSGSSYVPVHTCSTTYPHIDE